MLDGLRVGWRAIRHLNHRSHLYVWGNILWLILSLPLVTAPGAWMALVRLSYVMHRDPGVTMDDFWKGFRENWRRGIILAFINALILVINLGNLISYWNMPGLLGFFLRASWGFVLVAWFALQLYAYPLFFAMEKPTLFGAFRNAGVMILQNPLYTLVIVIIGAIFIALGVVLPPILILLTGGAVASLANTAVQNRLWAAGIQPRPVELDESAEQSFYADYEA